MTTTAEIFDLIHRIQKERNEDPDARDAIDIMVPNRWLELARGTPDQANSLAGTVRKTSDVSLESARRFVAELRGCPTLTVSPCACPPRGAKLTYQDRTHGHCANYATLKGRPHPPTYWRRIDPESPWLRVTWEQYIATPFVS